ncbi:MAG: lipoyl(octanoyl) transferase LipB [Gemmatimonadaceae bacterium]
MSGRELWVADFGTRAYGEMLEIQRAVARARISGEIAQDVLILVEHPPVITLGRSSKDAHLLSNPEQLSARGVEVFEVERGGDVTFHGPGQLVGYPIIDLKRHKQDLHWYLRRVEDVLIQSLESLGIPAERVEKYTGVWTNGKKIASIGVHARDWVTWHGFALNVTTELSFFDLIVPCGIPEVTMTSVEREITERAEGVRFGAPPPSALAEDVRQVVVASAGGVFDLDPRTADPTSIEATVGHTSRT